MMDDCKLQEQTHRYLSRHFGWLNREADCTAAQPFLPLMLISAWDVRVQTPITAHLERCRACRADLRRLAGLGLSEADLMQAAKRLAGQTDAVQSLSPAAQAVVETIAVRSNSGVVTTAQFVEGQEVLQVRAVRPSGGWVSGRMRAAAGLAAAIVIMAALLWMRMPQATALDVNQFYQSLKRVENISVRTLDSPHQTLLQQIWVSQPLGLRLFLSEHRKVLCRTDVNRQIWQDDQGNITVVPSLAAVPEVLLPPWGLLPFGDITLLPPEYNWRRQESPDSDVHVYELSWVETLADGRRLEKLWRGHLDRHTHLPLTIEWYERWSDDRPYQLMLTMEISYPDSQAVRQAALDSGLGTGGDF